MREAGVDLVTLGVFSWALARARRRDTYDFGWLDEVMDVLHDAGIGVDLATATASPPPWLSHRHPEMLPVDRRRPHALAGQPAGLVPELAGLPRARAGPVHGRWPSATTTTRRWRCGTSPTSSAATTPCYCDVSAAAFRAWLARRYGDARRAQRGLGHRLLVASATPTSSRSSRRASPRPSPTRPSCSTSAASAPTSCSTTSAPSATCCTRSPPACR